MCISWTRKGLISLMHGVTMKILRLGLLISATPSTQEQTCYSRYGQKIYNLARTDEHNFRKKKGAIILKTYIQLAVTENFTCRPKETG